MQEEVFFLLMLIDELLPPMLVVPNACEQEWFLFHMLFDEFKEI